MKRFSLVINYNDTNNHPSWQKGSIYMMTDSEEELRNELDKINKHKLFDTSKLVVKDNSWPQSRFTADIWCAQ